MAQALHCFRFDEFSKEVKRGTKAGGIFAGWMYSLLRIPSEIYALIEGHHYNTLDGYWNDERRYVDEEYRNMPFTFTKMDVPTFTIEYNWTIEELEGYLNTWSALQKLITENNYNPVSELVQCIKPIWNQEQMKISFPVHLLLGKIIK